MSQGYEEKNYICKSKHVPKTHILIRVLIQFSKKVPISHIHCLSNSQMLSKVCRRSSNHSRTNGCQ